MCTGSASRIRAEAAGADSLGSAELGRSEPRERRATLPESVPSALVTAKPGFERAFREYGLPLAIRTDSGAPFATQQSMGCRT